MPAYDYRCPVCGEECMRIESMRDHRDMPAPKCACGVLMKIKPSAPALKRDRKTLGRGKA